MNVGIDMIRNGSFQYVWEYDAMAPLKICPDIAPMDMENPTMAVIKFLFSTGNMSAKILKRMGDAPPMETPVNARAHNS
jgi:hypothetical protein